MKNKQILVFQHLAVEHPGIFRDFFHEDGMHTTVVELDAGDAIPDLAGYDALWVMGGPMDVWQEDMYPWLRDEKRAIKEAVDDYGMPFVGICLGHQLLADALGGEVGPGSMAEVGVMPVYKTELGKHSPYFAGLPDEMYCLQWHGAEVKVAPPGFDILVSSEQCPIQSLARGRQVITMQYHQEIIDSTVTDWSDIPEYKSSLEQSLGEHAVVSLQQMAMSRMQEFNATAKTLYRNWKETVFQQ